MHPLSVDMDLGEDQCGRVRTVIVGALYEAELKSRWSLRTRNFGDLPDVIDQKTRYIRSKFLNTFGSTCILYTKTEDSK